MNIIIATTAFITTAVLSATLINPISYNEDKIEEQVSHDWECEYIVEDFYTQEGGSIIHYVDEVIENVDGSITFIGEDGLVTKIPYPYYRIEKNPNKND